MEIAIIAVPPEEAQKELKRVKKADTKSIYVGKPWVYEAE